MSSHSASHNAVQKFEQKESDIYIVATVDGQVLGINRINGAVMWTWPESNLGVNIESRFSEPADSKTVPYYLVEPNTDGSVYVAEADLPIKKLPLSIKRLAEYSPYHSEDGTVYVAERSTEIILFNPITGSIRYRLSPDSGLLAVHDPEDKHLASIGRIAYRISVYNLDNPNIPSWNISYTELISPQLSTQPTSTGCSLSPGIDGSLVCWDEHGRTVWKNMFNSPVVSVFTVLDKKSNDGRYSLSMLNLKPKDYTSDKDYNSMVHIGLSNRTPYLLASSRYHHGDVNIDPFMPQFDPRRSVLEYDLQAKCPSFCYPGSKMFPDCLKGANINLVEAPVQISLIPASTAANDILSTTPLLIDAPQYLTGFENALEANSRGAFSFQTFYTVILTLIVGFGLSFLFLRKLNKPVEVSQSDKPKTRGRRKATNEKEKDDLQVNTNEILGYGSHGTVVFGGTFHGRPVAVKRLLVDFFDVADREVDLLLKSDSHPNVVRYFCQKRSRQFLYIALEKCLCSLYDVIENPAPSIDLSMISEMRTVIDKRSICCDLISGVVHLHSLNIVHRDIKPQNVLISVVGPNSYRALITDFGLCKKLTDGQNTFYFSTESHGGTTGWRAPELIKLNGAEKEEQKELKLSKAVDVFSTGLVFYYTLTGGHHPFGGLYDRDRNILANTYNLTHLEDEEAVDVVKKMININALGRIDGKKVLSLPFFWNPLKKLTFLQDLSDRLDIEDREASDILKKLETLAQVIIPTGWFDKVDEDLFENLGKYRKYSTDSVQDLLRAIRNKKNHYQDLPAEVKSRLGPLPNGFLLYFTTRFPHLFISLYNFTEDVGLSSDASLAIYFS